ncbi:MAG: hypothetical protein KF809_17685 [Chloroflexi bacterium]|nr:hypothetical protein [Chloroflexota bacterium]
MSWRELKTSWHDTDVANCDVCGNLIVRRYWSFIGGDGQEVRACREDDERLAQRLGIRTTEIEAARAAWQARAGEATDGTIT